MVVQEAEDEVTGVLRLELWNLLVSKDGMSHHYSNQMHQLLAKMASLGQHNHPQLGDVALKISFVQCLVSFLHHDA